jgi:hypothetical protein
MSDPVARAALEEARQKEIDERIERVARAIHQSQEPWDDFEIDRVEWFNAARMALAAINQPE